MKLIAIAAIAGIGFASALPYTAVYADGKVEPHAVPSPERTSPPPSTPRLPR